LATGWTVFPPEVNVTSAAGSPFLERHRLSPLEAAWWLIALAFFFVFPDYLAVATSVLVMALFALSLDLLLGFAGVLSLGHAVSFGIGAYVCALINLAGWHEALTGVLVAGAGSGLFALAIGPLILRLTGLPFIMVTLGIGAIVYEAANKAVWLTGGDNGLPGVTLDPLFGVFRWSVLGQTSYLYVLGWLLVLFYVSRRIVSSPFGVALQGVRENPDRMRLIGAPVLRHLVTGYAIASTMAGVAGALSAQTNAFVGLEVLSLNTSIDGLVMLVLGGVGRLYGGLVGAPLYMFVQHFAQQWNPYYWMFLIGALLIIIVRFSRGGLLGFFDDLLRRIRQGGRP
jgi:branched-chain amino acid transport system permease protein